MSESKKDKNRIEKLNKFKQLQKSKIKKNIMSEKQAPQMRPFRQVPVWKEDAKIEMTGVELMQLQQFFNIFLQPVKAMQDIFSRHITNGTIEIKYQDEKGEEIPKEEIQNQLKSLSEYYANLPQQEESTEEVASTSNLVTETGEPISKNELKAV